MKKRRYLAMIFAIVMTVLVITGCENGGSVTTNPGTSSTTTTTQKPEATPTEATVAEPTEAASPTEVVVEEPTEAASPTEAIVSEENTIDGVNFTPFIKNENIDKVLKNANLQETRLIFFDYSDNGQRRAKFEDGGYAVLKNGETYHRKFDDHAFVASLYSPKEIESASIEYNGTIVNFIEKGASEDAVQNRMYSTDLLKFDGGTIEKEIKITYDDGSSETFTFTVTDQ
ncbi:MAG: hypothetical protein K5697_15315 [Lachnospiraceae bacterium]|nr:hypothetical protein [Lachnospiraceae bacterium]